MHSSVNEIGKKVIAAIPNHVGFVLAKVVMVKNVDGMVYDEVYVVDYQGVQCEIDQDKFISIPELKKRVTQYGLQYVAHILKVTVDQIREWNAL